LVELRTVKTASGAARQALASTMALWVSRDYAAPMTAVDDIARSKYVSLTTFRKDGTPVATPVWHVVDGGQLFIVSEANAGKVKRIRRNSSVVLAACDARGRVAPGASTVQATARLLDAAGTADARRRLAQRYLLSRIGNWAARLLHLRRPEMAGIAVSF
jgi:PPOX class probable F420-dependent enzyme